MRTFWPMWKFTFSLWVNKVAFGCPLPSFRHESVSQILHPGHRQEWVSSPDPGNRNFICGALMPPSQFLMLSLSDHCLLPFTVPVVVWMSAPQKTSSVKGLVPTSWCYWKVIESRVCIRNRWITDDFILSELLSRTWLEEVGHFQGMHLWRVYLAIVPFLPLCLSLCSLVIMRWASLLDYILPSIIYCPSSIAMKPAYHELEHWNHEPKWIFPP